MDAENISQLDDPAFRELITTNIHPADDTAAVWEQLTKPEVVERTFNTLKELRLQTERSMSRKRHLLDEYQAECLLRGSKGRQDWFAEKRNFEDWKRRANNFRHMVEARHAQARNALKGTHEDRARVERGTRIALIKLCQQIQRHQAAFAVSGRRAEQADYELWGLLDEVSLPLTEGGYASLSQMLRTYWTPTGRDSHAGRRASERLMKQAPAGRSATFEGATKARHIGNDKPLADG